MAAILLASSFIALAIIARNQSKVLEARKEAGQPDLTAKKFASF